MPLDHAWYGGMSMDFTLQPSASQSHAYPTELPDQCFTLKASKDQQANSARQGNKISQSEGGEGGFSVSWLAH